MKIYLHLQIQNTPSQSVRQPLNAKNYHHLMLVGLKSSYLFFNKTENLTKNKTLLSMRIFLALVCKYFFVIKATKPTRTKPRLLVLKEHSPFVFSLKISDKVTKHQLPIFVFRKFLSGVAIDFS